MEIETAQVQQAVINARVSVRMVKQFHHHALNARSTDAHAAPTQTQNQTAAGVTPRHACKLQANHFYSPPSKISRGTNIHIGHHHYTEMISQC